MWVIKIVTASGISTQIHFASMEEASEEFARLTDGIFNNDDNSIRQIQIDSVTFPTERDSLN